MLFSFRSADAAKYPRFLNVQTFEMAFDDEGIARLIKQGRAHYDESENAVVFTEFERPRVQVIGSASEWPDVIGSQGFIENPIIVSQRVVAAFARHNITGCRPKAVEVTKKAGRKLHVRTAPQYYFLEVSGQIGVDVPTCLRAGEAEADLANKLKSAWDGSDVFIHPREAAGRWALFCGERVFELARAEKWTNFGFQPLHYFARFHKTYLKHESSLPLPLLVERYVDQLK